MVSIMQTPRAPRRIIDLTEDELDRKLEAKLALASGVGSAVDPDRALPRKQAAALLEVSLTQLDLLSRRDRPDPLPYYVVGAARRYLRAEVMAWLKRQREVA